MPLKGDFFSKLNFIFGLVDCLEFSFFKSHRWLTKIFEFHSWRYIWSWLYLLLLVCFSLPPNSFLLVVLLNWSSELWGVFCQYLDRQESGCHFISTAVNSFLIWVLVRVLVQSLPCTSSRFPWSHDELMCGIIM